MALVTGIAGLFTRCGGLRSRGHGRSSDGPRARCRGPADPQRRCCTVSPTARGTVKLPVGRVMAEARWTDEHRQTAAEGMGMTSSGGRAATAGHGCVTRRRAALRSADDEHQLEAHVPTAGGRAEVRVVRRTQRCRRRGHGRRHGRAGESALGLCDGRWWDRRRGAGDRWARVLPRRKHRSLTITGRCGQCEPRRPCGARRCPSRARRTVGRPCAARGPLAPDRGRWQGWAAGRPRRR
jgi:hypothetical protein